VEALRAGNRSGAERLLADCLDDSRMRLVETYAHLVAEDDADGA
jgi:hypothetical protein